MKVSYDWLKDYVDVSLTPQELAKQLTARGVVVETLTGKNPGVAGVVVGRVAEIVRHPGADTLWVCQVEVGGGQRLQIVTGAQNVRQGDLVPAAIPGSQLPGKSMAVALLRGQESHGMLCSADELGIDEGGDGILILPPDPDLEPGQDVAEVLGLNDSILELDLTANYASHCQAMVGVAQEVAAILGTAPAWPEAYSEEETGTNAAKQIRVEIQAPDLCPRYAARVVKGVKVGPSPAWLQARVRSVGMRPINNIVDISNFVMMELGQPLHTFDYDRIAGRQIIVRRAGAGERFTTLDNVERVLDTEVLVIADGSGPVALAGVMGGLESEVTDGTVNVLIESAAFENINNRRTALKMNLPSEASRRFTKGVDPSGCLRAADRCAQLIALLAGGKVQQGHVDAYPVPVAPPVVMLRTGRANAHLGLTLTLEQMAEHLTNLGMVVCSPEDLAVDLSQGPPEGEGQEEGVDLSGRPVWTALHQVSPVPLDPDAYAGWAQAAWASLERAGEVLESLGGSATPEDGAPTGAGSPPEALVVVIPTRRRDLSIEVDLIEEIARSEGYDAIPAVLPVLATARGGRSQLAEQVLAARRALAGAGLDEVMTHSLIHPRVHDRLQLPADHPLRRSIAIANPMYEERSILRTSLLPGLLDALQYNANRQIRDLAIFDLSEVYLPREGEKLPAEPKMLGIALMGSQTAAGWNAQPIPSDFFGLKGIIETLLDGLLVTGWTVSRSAHPSLHPGRQAQVEAGGAALGVFGELHPKVVEAWDLTGRICVAEINFEVLASAAAAQREYRSVPRFPAVSRDVALVISENVPAAQVAAAIREAGGTLVESVSLFDVYQGEHVKLGYRSLAYSITYRAADRTLTDTDVESAHGGVRTALQALGAELRS